MLSERVKMVLFPAIVLAIAIGYVPVDVPMFWTKIILRVGDFTGHIPKSSSSFDSV